MEGEGAQSDPADYDSLLPPRKRLLAGLKRQNCDCSPPLSFVSDELSAYLQGLLNSSALSPEEILEASKAAAFAAAKAADAARAVATTKAIAAANARAFAKSVLGVVAASVDREENSKKNHPRRKKMKKKHVPVELLYKSKCPVLSSETDEELARRLHRAMNSSPRISTRLTKKSETLGAIQKSDGGTVSNGNPTSLLDDCVGLSNGNSMEKSEGRVAMFSRVECREKVVEASESFENHQPVGKVVVHAKRGKGKQKKLSLSQCCMRGRESSRVLPRVEDHPAEPKCGIAEDMPAPTRRPSKEQVPLEAKPEWKCKKFKVSQCHSEGKNLHSRCSIPAVTTTSALVKVD